MGNPPFVGYAYQSAEQKKDMQLVLGTFGKNLDFVCAWYKKASDVIKNTNIKCAFVSTNSICQGEQVSVLWEPLFEQGIQINFAYRTFRWDSESSLKAHVHCVIVGFSDKNSEQKGKYIFDESNRKIKATNINGYLLDAKNIFISKRTHPLCNNSEMSRGSQPTDDGNFILSKEEYEDYKKKEPQGVKYIRPFMMGKDFIDRKPRFCFWLIGANPSDLKKCPILLQRIEAIRKFRLNSTKQATQEKANTPTLFDEIKAVDTEYIAIPVVSSESRRYIPIDYLSPEIIAGNKLFMLPNATLYEFGVLTSNVHNAWMRAVCGRLEMRYRYSKDIVYNNFPWCTPTDEQKAKIEATAQAILDARANHPDCSLADLYDETTMPPDLRKAHQANDKAVMQAYNFPIKITESECVAELFKMYEKLTKEK